MRQSCRAGSCIVFWHNGESVTELLAATESGPGVDADEAPPAVAEAAVQQAQPPRQAQRSGLRQAPRRTIYSEFELGEPTGS